MTVDKKPTLFENMLLKQSRRGVFAFEIPSTLSLAGKLSNSFGYYELLRLETELVLSGDLSLAWTIDLTSGCMPELLIAMSIVSRSYAQDGRIVS